MQKMKEIVPGIAFTAPLDDADDLLAKIKHEVEFRDEIVDFGNGPVTMPRQTGWYGDAGAIYTYTGMTNSPSPWTPALIALRDRLNAALGLRLNSCLVGLYPDGAHMVDWHADDEPELRDTIVSVSLGATRTFQLRRTPDDDPLSVSLEHGSVVLMTVASQHVWQHSVPSEPAAGARINLTFRTIAAD